MIIFLVSRGFARDFHNFSCRYAWNSHRYPTEYSDHLVCLILLLRYNQWSSRSVSGDFCLIFDFFSVRIIRTELFGRILSQQSSESDEKYSFCVEFREVFKNEIENFFRALESGFLRAKRALGRLFLIIVVYFLFQN